MDLGVFTTCRGGMVFLVVLSGVHSSTKPLSFIHQLTSELKLSPGGGRAGGRASGQGAGVRGGAFCTCFTPPLRRVWLAVTYTHIRTSLRTF